MTHADPAYLNDRLSLSCEAALDGSELRLNWTSPVLPDEGGAWDLMRWSARWRLGQVDGSVTLHSQDLDGELAALWLRPEHLLHSECLVSFGQGVACFSLWLSLEPFQLPGDLRVEDALRRRGWLSRDGGYHVVVVTCSS